MIVTDSVCVFISLLLLTESISGWSTSVRQMQLPAVQLHSGSFPRKLLGGASLPGWAISAADTPSLSLTIICFLLACCWCWRGPGERKPFPWTLGPAAKRRHLFVKLQACFARGHVLIRHHTLKNKHCVLSRSNSKAQQWYIEYMNILTSFWSLAFWRWCADTVNTMRKWRTWAVPSS